MVQGMKKPSKPKLGRPPKPAAERRVTLSLRVRPATRAKLDTMAQAIGTSVSHVVEILVDQVRPRQ